ncbi:SLATT domain-containing protein [bacterium]|nr:SLATT domain-containing protein [bacterium]NBW78245.1 SLATT domain-containing protein [Betaproteobacteria bacterium]NDC96136.1 SLATT domain-containing protein [bacterium]NDD85614.1 SLATT domain-containing protein [bacterium]
MDEAREISWSNQIEDIIAQEAEMCRGLAWIHQRAEGRLSARNNFIAIPVIILSTLSGTASIGSDKLFGGSDMASVGIGLVSILVGILQTLSTYFKFAQKSEAHHIAYLQYSKLFSWVRVELGLPRKERIHAQDLLKQLRDSMTRLAETTPMPPQTILDEFNSKFKEYDASIARPLEVNGLHKIVVYRRDISQSPRVSETNVLVYEDIKGSS